MIGRFTIFYTKKSASIFYMLADETDPKGKKEIDLETLF